MIPAILVGLVLIFTLSIAVVVLVSDLFKDCDERGSVVLSQTLGAIAFWASAAFFCIVLLLIAKPNYEEVAIRNVYTIEEGGKEYRFYIMDGPDGPIFQGTLIKDRIRILRKIDTRGILLYNEMKEEAVVEEEKANG